MKTIVVTSRTEDWSLEIPGVQVVMARDYLTDPEWVGDRGLRVYNLCRSYRYQTEGYYVSLLAAARRHRPFPDLMTVLDMRSPAVLRSYGEDLDSVIQHSLAELRSDKFELSVYFGRNMAERHDRLARRLFVLLPAPLLRASFQRERGRWRLSSVKPIATRDVPESHREFLTGAAQEYFARPRFAAPRSRPSRYTLAILHDPDEQLSPSNPKALARFRSAAQKVGFGVELIRKDDYARIGEFDALFIRETTAVDHHTFRFAQRAEAEGLVVVDDPTSILRCTNKIFQAEALQRLNIPTPRTWIAGKTDVAELERRIDFPCVLKHPDSAFSKGVVRCDDVEEFRAQAAEILDRSDLLLVQEFTPSDFDWRVGVLGGTPLFACRYHMAKGHWQIMQRQADGDYSYGKTDTLPVYEAPPVVVKMAVRAAGAMGDGFYGVDLKQIGKQVIVMEVNDNPNLDGGNEDAVLKGELYRVMAEWFLDRVERRRAASKR
jgi:glutathione synthase/RimK-type ligase-like ATP-grasp enzyme